MGNIHDILAGFLGKQIDGSFAGISILIVVVVLFLFSIALIMSSYDTHGNRKVPRWNPKRWVAPCLEFFYGLLILEFDVVTWGYLGFLVLHDDQTIPLWFTFSSLAAAGLAIMAFKHWAREKKE